MDVFLRGTDDFTRHGRVLVAASIAVVCGTTGRMQTVRCIEC